MKYKTYLVGGAVRDEILGRKSKDLDYVMLAPSFDDMRSALLDDGCKIFVEKPEYLTIRANHPTLGAVDFACARKDGNYSDGRRPDSTEITTDLVADLSRRDFTCNAIAKDVETGELVDPFNGRRDIKDRMLRAVGGPITRLTEDKLRAFRALRFSVTRNFIIDSPLYQAIKSFSYPHDYDGVSTERIREELNKMFSVNWFEAMKMLYEYDILTQVIRSRGIWFEPTTKKI